MAGLSQSPDPLADDPTHPIPEVYTLDIIGVRKEGGADLAVIIASPLRWDERSKHRLHAKVSCYINYVNTSEFETECGRPSPENTTIKVLLHPGSAPEAKVFLSTLAPAALRHNCKLAVEDLPGKPRPAKPWCKLRR